MSLINETKDFELQFSKVTDNPLLIPSEGQTPDVSFTDKSTFNAINPLLGTAMTPLIEQSSEVVSLTSLDITPSNAVVSLGDKCDPVDLASDNTNTSNESNKVNEIKDDKKVNEINSENKKANNKRRIIYKAKRKCATRSILNKFQNDNNDDTKDIISNGENSKDGHVENKDNKDIIIDDSDDAKDNSSRDSINKDKNENINKKETTKPYISINEIFDTILFLFFILSFFAVLYISGK